MKIFLPYRREFGYILMWHAPQVFAEKGPKAVIIEEGFEAIYPDCDYHYVETKHDMDRMVKENKWLRDLIEVINPQMRELYGPDIEYVPQNTKAKFEYFIPTPTVQIHQLIDVVICPRKREYGPDKNWKHWQLLADGLIAGGLNLMSVGHPDTSFHLDGVPQVWDLVEGRCLDATIAAMLQSKLVVATDNGLAHLALMCGKDLMMVSHLAGYVAEGHDDVGNPYWPITLSRFHKENHTNAMIDVAHYTWNDPGRMIVHVLKHMEGLKL